MYDHDANQEKFRNNSQEDQTVYFSLSPKKDPESLYNREKELELLLSYYKTGRLILLTGIRRIGKTSLLLVFLEELKKKGEKVIFMDCRNYGKPGGYDRFSFDRDFTKAILEHVRKYLKLSKYVSKITIAGVELSFEKTDQKPHLPSYLKMIDKIMKKRKKKLVIAFDEAQFLRYYGRGGSEILNLLAFSYDHLDNVLFILTGSEVGVLHDFLKTENPNSPLYGRYLHEITLGRFSPEKSFDFLYRGFQQLFIEPLHFKIQEAVRELDGIVGYLSIYGYVVYTTKDWDMALEETKKMALGMVKKEIKELRKRSENYFHVLKAVAKGSKTYSQIKKFIANRYNKITDQTLSNNLSTLQKMGFLAVEYEKNKKTYVIPDPMVQKSLIR